MHLSKVLVLVSLSYAFLLGAAPLAYGQLSPAFYDRTCPNVTRIVRDVIEDTLLSDPRMRASLIRLHFHDCFVLGCEASVLLDNSDTIESEKQALPNNDSLRGFDVVDRMKARLEADCPGIVSCADILTIAAEESVVLSGGPSWAVPLGRRDGRNASRSAAENLPSPFDTLDEIKSKFTAHGLNNDTDLVALSGAHTLGRTECQFFEDRLYNLTDCSINPQPADETLNKTYLEKLRGLCSCNGSWTVQVNLEPKTPDGFDNNYFSNLQTGKGLFLSDQELFSTPGADTIDIVNSFSANQTAFFENFVISMIRLGNLGVLTGTEGEIRLNCSVVNVNSTGQDAVLVSSI